MWWDGGHGHGEVPESARVGAGFHGRPGAAGWSGWVAVESGRVQGLQAVPCSGQVAGPFPAGWDLQDSSSGVADQPGLGGQDRKAQCLGGGLASSASSTRWRSQAVSEVASPTVYKIETVHTTTTIVPCNL